MAKDLTQAKYQDVSRLCHAVINDKAKFEPEQVKFAEGLAERLKRDGLQTLTTYLHHGKLAAIRERLYGRPATPGHNSAAAPAAASGASVLGQAFNRIQTLNAEIGALNADKSEVFQELKAQGYDLPTFRTVLARAQQDRAAVIERDSLVDTYERDIFGEEEK